jgi:hypothetical protein
MPVFVDTGAWFAYFVRRDLDHAAAVEWMRQNRQPLVTTGYGGKPWKTELSSFATSVQRSTVGMNRAFRLMRRSVASHDTILGPECCGPWAVLQCVKWRCKFGRSTGRSAS